MYFRTFDERGVDAPGDRGDKVGALPYRMERARGAR